MKSLIAIFLMAALPVMGQQSNPKEAFLEKWEHSKAYLLEIIEVMPSEHFDYQPTEREMTFSEQLLHIKGNMDWLSTTYFSSEPFDKKKNDSSYTKEEIKRLVETAFDQTSQKVAATNDASLAETVEFFAGPKSRLQILYLLMDHVTHHRGQLIVYLNLKGIEPPRYIGW